jgi:glycyl-tRNA synthetase (class II)
MQHHEPQNIPHIQLDTDCEGTQTGYRCWAAGEKGFTNAVVSRIVPVVRESARAEIEHLIDIETKTHAKHHEYINSQIEMNAIAKERWEKVKTQTLGWGILALAGWLGTVVLEALMKLKGHS